MPTAIAAAAPPADADVPAVDDVSGAAAAATLFGGSAAAAEEANAAGAARGAKVPSRLCGSNRAAAMSSSPDLTPHFPHIQVPSAWKAAEARVESFAWHRLLNDLDPLARYAAPHIPLPTSLPTSRYPHPSTRIPTAPARP